MPVMKPSTTWRARRASRLMRAQAAVRDGTAGDLAHLRRKGKEFLDERDPVDLPACQPLTDEPLDLLARQVYRGESFRAGERGLLGHRYRIPLGSAGQAAHNSS